MPGHPTSYAVREERIIAAVDTWLNQLVGDDRLEETICMIAQADREAAVEPGNVASARRRRDKLAHELERIVAAIRSGMDPDLGAAETRRIQQDIRSTSAVAEEWQSQHQRPAGLTEEEIRQALTKADGIVSLLRRASRPDRSELYRSLGLSLQYEKEAATGMERVHVRLLLSRSGGSVVVQDIGMGCLTSSA